MKFFHKHIMFMSIVLGLTLACMDAFFDWLYHYEGEDTYLVYLVTDFPLHEVYWRGSFLAVALLFGMMVSYFYSQKKDSESILENIFENVVPICVTNSDHDIVMANRSYHRIFGASRHSGTPIKCYDHRPGPKCRTSECPLEVILAGNVDSHICESTKEEPGKPARTFIIYASPFKDKKGKLMGVIECFQDITIRRELEKEKEQLIDKLNSALAEVKKLSGFLPICATCKKVRDDKGYWKQIESYIAEHSDAEFSHSICPECAAKYYANLEK